MDKTFDLFCELGATDDQTDFDICYASAIKGMSGASPEEVAVGLEPLFDKILGLPAPPVTVGPTAPPAPPPSTQASPRPKISALR